PLLQRAGQSAGAAGVPLPTLRRAVPTAADGAAPTVGAAPSPPPTATGRAGATTPPGAAAQRAGPGRWGGGAQATATVQRSAAGGDAGHPATTATARTTPARAGASVQRVAGASRGPVQRRAVDGAGESAADTDVEALIKGFDRRHLDALAHRLVEPISRLVRADLRASRERSGRWRDGAR
ncbi:hypothetical protein AWW66_20385, partial [Micromonospora rosaria]